tara:strand:- start:152 stop:535 length:384 start_codon:yes stop_codon:yes gene_type:complete
MKKVKTRADKDKYGELLFGRANTPSEQYMKPLLEAYNREYSKAFNIFPLVAQDLNQEFTALTKDADRLKLIGQLDQKIMLVQKVDTGRYYRLPTKEVAEGFQTSVGLKKRKGNLWYREPMVVEVNDI